MSLDRAELNVLIKLSALSCAIAPHLINHWFPINPVYGGGIFLLNERWGWLSPPIYFHIFMTIPAILKIKNYWLYPSLCFALLKSQFSFFQLLSYMARNCISYSFHLENKNSFQHLTVLKILKLAWTPKSHI